MHTDHFYTQGTLHKENQDYALSGHIDNESPFAIVSDGCSSAHSSDFGARLLTRASLPYIYKKAFDHDAFYHGVLTSAHTFSRALGLHDDSLCATLLTARIRDDKFEVLVAGDGFVAFKDKQGILKVHQYDFESGAPFYLRYDLDADIRQGYFEKFGTEAHWNTYTFAPGKEPEVEKRTFNVDPAYPCFYIEQPVSETEFVAVLSDGAANFVKLVETSTGKENKRVDPVEVLPPLLSFKNLNGEFVQRRCNRAFKDFKKNGYQNTDDVSVSVIATGG